MRYAVNLFIINYLATDQRFWNEELHFVRLAAILAEIVKNANESHRDASGCRCAALLRGQQSWKLHGLAADGAEEAGGETARSEADAEGADARTVADGRGVAVGQRAPVECFAIRRCRVT